MKILTFLLIGIVAVVIVGPLFGEFGKILKFVRETIIMTP